MRIMIRPSESPETPVDITNTLISAVARELSRVQGHDEERNWREATMLVEALVCRSLAGPFEPGLTHAPSSSLSTTRGLRHEEEPVRIGRGRIPHPGEMTATRTETMV
jgi:hypothetical protein